MTSDKILKKIVDLEEKIGKLPPLSARETEIFGHENMISSVFYSNLLEGNTLSRKEAIKVMFKRNNGGYKE